MELEKNIKCICSYDGSKFNGWQIQPDFRSVQEEIELALFKIHKHQVDITGAGRTDRGVHAKGQCLHFDVGKEIPLLKIKNTLSGMDVIKTGPISLNKHIYQ